MCNLHFPGKKNLRISRKLASRLVSHYSANKGPPLRLGRGVCETESKNGRSRPRKPFISRVFCARRGINPGRNYIPPPLPPFLAKRRFSGEGGRGVYSEPPRGRNFTPPPFMRPPTPRRVFSGVGGWGCIKFGPVIKTMVSDHGLGRGQTMG